jgi:hypothetical protein
LESKVTLENNGDLCIRQVQQELGEKRTCQVSLVSIIRRRVGLHVHRNKQIIDPHNYKPMHLYKQGAVAAGDVSRLKMVGGGYLRVVFKSMVPSQVNNLL